ncbi:MAG: hypothetical protein ACI9UT_001379 [Flavobacteriales bacterium]|jgi:hypothetical protein
MVNLMKTANTLKYRKKINHTNIQKTEALTNQGMSLVRSSGFIKTTTYRHKKKGKSSVSNKTSPLKYPCISSSIGAVSNK